MITFIRTLPRKWRMVVLTVAPGQSAGRSSQLFDRKPIGFPLLFAGMSTEGDHHAAPFNPTRGFTYPSLTGCFRGLCRNSCHRLRVGWMDIGLSTGAPKGLSNGNYKNGTWTAEAIEERKWLRSWVSEFAKKDPAQ